MDSTLVSDRGKITKISLVGGTFDALHRGHQEYIKFALHLSDHLYLQLASDRYCENFNKPYRIKPYVERKYRIEIFLESIDSTDKVTILELDSSDDLKRFCIDSDDIDIVIAGAEYVKLFKQYNECRKILNKKPFEIKMMRRIQTQNGDKISSTFAYQKSLEYLITILPYFHRIAQSQLLLTNAMPGIYLKLSKR